MDAKPESGCGFFYLSEGDPSKCWQLRTVARQVKSLKPVDKTELVCATGVLRFFKDSENNERVVGFFSAHRLVDIGAPDYGRSHFFFIDDIVFGNTPDVPFISLKSRLMVREVEAGLGEKTLKKFQYYWPVYRDFFEDDPMRSSKDDLDNLVKLLKHTHPEWLRA